MFPLRDDNPTRIVPLITWTLIAVNVMVFFYQASLGPRAGEIFIYKYGTIPAVVVGTKSLPASLSAIPPAASIFTSMFLHGSWMHLIGNMWFLWIFGNNIEEAMGAFRFLIFYLLCGFFASLTHILSNASSTIPSIGASGAISGVLGAYAVIYPRARVWTLIFLFFFVRLIYLPAAIVLLYWFILQVLYSSVTGPQTSGGIAYGAHIGGFIAGVLLVGLFKKKKVRFFNPPRYRSSITWD